MSSRIDQRIVEMSFENHKFEKGIHQSKNSLKDFSNALQNMGTGKDFSGLENSVNSVSSSLSMMEQIGVGALRRIGEAAVNAGGSLIKSLTVDQLSEGLSKYQEKIEAVQTMVSAGYGLEEVEKSMAQLMWFSDETSYSFADMAGNMAKFISAGVDLKTSERAMQGIATWAAHSGKNSQAASIAMFNLSQAISMGYVDTMNWRSIMNQNMNTTMFKDIAIGVAEATGAIQKGQVTIQNFDSNLKDKWFTNDVLLKTLDQYSQYAVKVREVQEEMGFDTAKQAMDYMEAHSEKYSHVLNQIGNAAFKASQESKSFMDSINATMDAVSSGWLKTYEIIFGTLYEAKENFSALTEVLWTVFASSAETRNEMLQLIKDGGGIKKLFQTIKNIAVALLTPLRAISQAFDQFFPPRTETQWLGIINTLEYVTRRMIITEETASKIQRTFAGFFAVVDIGWHTFKLLGSSLYEVVKIFIPLSGNLLDMTASFGDFLVEMNQLIHQSGVFKYGLLGVKIAVVIVRDILTKIINTVSDFIHILWTTDRPLEFLGATVRNIFSGILDVLKTVTNWISSKFMNAMTSVRKTLNTKFDIDSESALGGIITILKEFIDFIAGEAADGLKTFGGALGDLDFSRIATFATGGILLLFINQLSNLTKSMSNVLNSTNSFITKFSKKLFGTTTKIKDLAFTFGVLSASLYVLSRIPWSELKTGLMGMAGALGLFVAAYASIQAITVISSKALNGIEVVKSTFSLLSLAGGVAVMAVAIKKISAIGEGEVWNAVKVMTAMMGLLVAYQTLSALISIIPGQHAVSVNFAGMTFGVLGLVGIVTLLQFISPEALRNGLGKLAAAVLVITAIQGLFGLVSKIGGGARLSFNLFSLTAGIIGLIGVIKLLNLISSNEISKGVGNVLLLGGVLSTIQLMFNVAGRIGGGVKFKTNMVVIQMGIISMIAIIAILGTMDPSKIQNGIKSITKMAGIIGALEILTALAARIGKGNKLQRILGSVSLTMLSFTTLIAILGIYKQDTIDKGLLTISKMAAIIVAFEMLSTLAATIGGGTKGVSSLLGMVATLLTITASLALLSMIDQEALRQATTSLGIAVLTIGVMSTGIGIMMKSLSVLSTHFEGIGSILQKLYAGFATMGVLIFATIAFLGVIKLINPLLDSISWTNLGKFSLGLGAIATLVVAFSALANVPGMSSGAAGLSSLIPGFAGTTAVVLAAAGLFKVIGWVLDDIKDIDWADMNKFITGIGLIGILATGITLLGPLLSVLGAGFGPVLIGAATAIAGVGMLIGTFVGLSALLEKLFGKDPDFLIRGIDKLISVGEGIGRFVGSIVGGFSSELLIQYGQGLSGFSAAVGNIDPASFAGVESLAKALLILTGTSMLDGVSRLLNFGKNPGEVFGQQLRGIINAFKGITVEEAVRTSNVLSALAPMANNLTVLAKASQSIPNSGGLLGGLMGNNDIDTFGKKINKFIKGLQEVTVRGTQHASHVLSEMTPMANNLKVFAKAADKIPNSGGFLGVFLGNNNVDTFGKMLSSFVGIFRDLNATADVGRASASMQAMTPMLGNLKEFATIAKGIPNSGGIVSWFTGENDIKNFVEQIAKFVKKLGKLDQSEVSSANNTIRSITTEMLPGLEQFALLSNNLNATGGWKQVFTGETSLNNFAKELKKFVKTLQGVDVSIIEPALNSLSAITNSFKTVGSEVISSAIESFENNKKPYQAGIAKLLEETIKIVESKKKPLADSFKDIINNALKESKNYVTQFKILGGDLVRGLQSGITANQSYATKAINNMSKNVITSSKNTFESRSPSKVFDDIGGWLGIGLGNGIKRNSNVAILASANMAYGVENAVRNSLDVHSESKKFNNIGEWVSKSVGSGIQNGKKAVLNKASELGVDIGDMSVKGISKSLVKGEGAVTTGINNLLDLLTGEKVTSEITKASNISGGMAGDSFVDGVSKTIGKSSGASSSRQKVIKSATELAEDAFQAFKKQMDYLTEYDLITPEVEIAKWEAFTKQQVKGTENQLKAEKKLNELKFNYSKTWIDKEKYYKRLSLEDELAAWTRVQQRYKEGHAYRLQAEREIFRLKQEIQQLDYQNAMDRIDEDKYYGRLNLSQELKRYKQIQSTLEENSADRKKVNREIFRVEKEIKDVTIAYQEDIGRVEEKRTNDRMRAEEEYYNKTKEVNDNLIRDIEAQTDAYENAVKSRTQSLYSAWGLFDKVDMPEVSGEELLRNLEDQVVAFDQWQAQFNTLTQKGISEGLVEELRSMGPKSLAQIVALNKLSGPELNKYVSLWDKKSREAKDQAVYELQDMKRQTLVNIDELIEDAATELIGYEQVWNESLKKINTDADKELDTLKTNWENAIGGMTKESIISVDQFKTDFSGKMTEVVDETDVKMGELEKNSQTTLQDINTDTSQQLTTLKTNWNENIGGMTKDGIEYIRQFRSNWHSEISGMVDTTRTQMSELTRLVNAVNVTGQNVSNSLASGITKKSSVVNKAAQNLGTTAIRGANSILMIKSPSRKFLEIGRYSAEGFAEGLRRFSGLVYSEGTGIGKTALEAVSLSMNSIPDLLENDADEFSITPILDLSNIRSGMDNIDSLFSRSSGFGLSANMDLLPLMNATNQNGILSQIKDSLMAVTNQEVDLTGTLTIQVVNDKGEIVDIAETAIKDILRRESR